MKSPTEEAAGLADELRDILHIGSDDAQKVFRSYLAAKIAEARAEGASALARALIDAGDVVPRGVWIRAMTECGLSVPLGPTPVMPEKPTRSG